MIRGYLKGRIILNSDLLGLAEQPSYISKIASEITKSGKFSRGLVFNPVGIFPANETDPELLFSKEFKEEDCDFVPSFKYEPEWWEGLSTEGFGATSTINDDESKIDGYWSRYSPKTISLLQDFVDTPILIGTEIDGFLTRFTYGNTVISSPLVKDNEWVQDTFRNQATIVVSSKELDDKTSNMFLEVQFELPYAQSNDTIVFAYHFTGVPNVYVVDNREVFGIGHYCLALFGNGLLKLFELVEPFELYDEELEDNVLNYAMEAASENITISHNSLNVLKFNIYRKRPTMHFPGFVSVDVDGKSVGGHGISALHSSDSSVSGPRSVSGRMKNISFCNLNSISTRDVDIVTPRKLAFAIQPYLTSIVFKFGYANLAANSYLIDSQVALKSPKIQSEGKLSLFGEGTFTSSVITNVNPTEPIELTPINTKEFTFDLPDELVKGLSVRLNFTTVDCFLHGYDIGFDGLFNTQVVDSEATTIVLQELVDLQIDDIVFYGETPSSSRATISGKTFVNALPQLRLNSSWDVKLQVRFEPGSETNTGLTTMKPEAIYTEEDDNWYTIFHGITTQGIVYNTLGEDKVFFKIDVQSYWNLVAEQVSSTAITFLESGDSTNGKPYNVIKALKALFALCGFSSDFIDFPEFDQTLNLSISSTPVRVPAGSKIEEYIQAIFDNYIPLRLIWDHSRSKFSLIKRTKITDASIPVFNITTNPEAPKQIPWVVKPLYVAEDTINVQRKQETSSFQIVPPEFNYLVVTGVASTDNKTVRTSPHAFWFNPFSVNWVYKNVIKTIPQIDRGPDWLGRVKHEFYNNSVLATYSDGSYALTRILARRIGNYAGRGLIVSSQEIPFFLMEHPNDATKVTVPLPESVVNLQGVNFILTGISSENISQLKKSEFKITLGKILKDEQVIIPSGV